jgi:Gpi18-like mannosyltransferase
MEDRAIDRVLRKKCKIGGLTFTIVELLFIFALTLLAMLARMQFISLKSGDWRESLSVWDKTIRDYGGWKFIKYTVTDYAPLYTYIMIGVAYVTSDSMIMLKCVSMLFDLISGICTLLVVWQLTASRVKSIIAYVLVMVMPTILLNSSAWTQCDSIYCSFIMLSLLYLLRDKSRLSLIMFSIAFCFKLQAVFFLPVLVICWLERRVKLADFLWIPAMYVLSCVPAWLAGRPWKELLLIYVKQANVRGGMALGFPNIYKLLGLGTVNLPVGRCGCLLTVGCLGILAYLVYEKCKDFNNDMIIALALASSLLCVYLLPYMHERYGYMALLFAVVYGMCNIGRIWMVIIIELSSLYGYMDFLFELHIMSAPVLAVALGCVVIVVLWDVICMLQLKGKVG